MNSQKAKNIRRQMKLMGMDPKLFPEEYKRIKKQWDDYEKSKTK